MEIGIKYPTNSGRIVYDQEYCDLTLSFKRSIHTYYALMK